MIRIDVTQAEWRASFNALMYYAPGDPRDYSVIQKTLRVAFTNKEANVLMDALAERDTEADGTEDLFEKLTGRTT